MWRINLFEKVPFLKALVKNRGFPHWIIFINLIFFYFFFLTGLFGTPVGNHNILIIFVWILWWIMLIAFMVPFGSRIWCTMCPLPIFGDWLQRHTFIKVRSGKTKAFKNKFYGLNKSWPKRFKNIWLQNFGFLAMAIFSSILITRPIVSVGVFFLFIFLASILAVVYSLRSFCHYLCPIAGFLSLYSMTATIELRSKDKEICNACKSKACIRGSDKGWACPWNVYMGNLDRNNYCGLCFECVKSCPNDNIGLFTRPFALSDTTMKGLDESWKAFIMLALAIAYSVVLLGPWGILKEWANVSEFGNWAGFSIIAGGFILSSLVLFPAVYGAFIVAAKKLSQNNKVSYKEFFLRFSYTLVPMGLLAWIAYSLPLIMVNGSYIIAVISDPFGKGWDLFHTAKVPWTPILPEWIPAIQVVILLTGLVYAVLSGFKVGKEFLHSDNEAYRSMIPLGAFHVIITGCLLRLFVG